jgi:hypothetical protein
MALLQCSKRGPLMNAMGQQRKSAGLFGMSASHFISGRIADIARGQLRADFVAEVRCRLFWSVIPSL